MIRLKTVAPLVLSVLVFGLPSTSFSQEKAGSSVGYGAEFDFNSRYIWRSLAWSAGAVWQPSAWIGWLGWNVSVWGNYVLGREPNRRQFNEVDFRLSTVREWGPFTIEPAFNVYTYPNQDRAENPTTGELEIQVTYDLGLAGLSLETAHYLDVIENKGGYVGDVGLQYEQSAGPGVRLAMAWRLLFANAKFNAFNVPLDKAALNGFVFELSLIYAVSDGLSIRPHFEWSKLLDGDLKAAVASSPWISSGRPSLVNFGLAVVYEK